MHQVSLQPANGAPSLSHLEVSADTHGFSTCWITIARTAESSVLEDQSIAFGLSGLAYSEF